MANGPFFLCAIGITSVMGTLTRLISLNVRVKKNNYIHFFTVLPRTTPFFPLKKVVRR